MDYRAFDAVVSCSKHGVSHRLFCEECQTKVIAFRVKAAQFNRDVQAMIQSNRKRNEQLAAMN